MNPSSARRCGAVLLALSPLAALADGLSPWYVGGTVGAIHLSTDFDSQVAGNSADSGSFSGHASMDQRLGGRVFGGYRLTPRFSYELDYFGLGKVSQDYTIPGPLAVSDGVVRAGRSRIDGYGLSAVSHWPMSPQVSFMGRVGVARTRVRYDESGALFDATFEDVKQTRPVLGLGVSWAPAPRWELRAEWARYFGIGRNFEPTFEPSSGRGKFDLDLLSAGIAFSF